MFMYFFAVAENHHSKFTKWVRQFCLDLCPEVHFMEESDVFLEIGENTNGRVRVGVTTWSSGRGRQLKSSHSSRLLVRVPVVPKDRVNH